MRLRHSFKKALGVSLAAAMLASSSALTALAYGGMRETTGQGAYVNLLPVEGITESVQFAGSTGTLTPAYNEDGSVTLTASEASWPGVKTPLSVSVNLNETPYLYYDFGNITPDSHTGLNGYINHEGDTQMQLSQIIKGSEEDMMEAASGRADLKKYMEDNGLLPEGGVLTIENILLVVGTWGAGSNVTVNQLGIGGETIESTDPSQPVTTESTSSTETTTAGSTGSEQTTGTTETGETAESTTTEAPEVKTPILSMDKNDWAELPDTGANPAGSLVIENGADGSLIFYNTNGGYPCAGYVPAEGITFNPAETRLEYDLTVEEKTNIFLFFGGSTPNEFKDNQFLSLNRLFEGADVNEDGDLVGDGTPLQGTMSLKDVLPQEALNEDGTATITGVKVFAIGAADKKVTIRTLNLVTKGEPVTTQPVTGTETTASATTQKDNPKTGENTAWMVVGAVLLAVSAGAVILTGKKARLK
jgi:LPXTG-motif cell wall-anchored protein